MKVFRIVGETHEEKFTFLERFLNTFVHKMKPLSKGDVRAIVREELANRDRQDIEEFLTDVE